MKIDLLQLTPMLTQSGFETITRLKEHPHAPMWNHAAGDSLIEDDIIKLREFRKGLDTKRDGWVSGEPSEDILNTFVRLKESVPLFQNTMLCEPAIRTEGATKKWAAIKTISREDIALRVEQLVPSNRDISRLIVYSTSGTTGHFIRIPGHPFFSGSYQALIEYAMARHTVYPHFDSSKTACFLVGFQIKTETFATALTYWNEAGFAKINLNRNDWHDAQSPHNYFEAMKPLIITGDPLSFAEMITMKIKAEPLALISTALIMGKSFKSKLSEYFHCPVIDLYSTTETGPIAYSCPAGDGFHILPNDMYVEAIDTNGCPVAESERGEITITCARNPFLPLLRYRTGDFGRIDYRHCICGDPMPKIIDLEGRSPVIFQSAQGGPVHSVDISRVLGEFPLVQHEFIQRADLSCCLRVRCLREEDRLFINSIHNGLQELFGDLPLKIDIVSELANKEQSGKVIPYTTFLSK
ncbi:MAG: hypothetical protein ACMUIP_13615 [bacterium]